MGVYLSNIEMPRTHPITVEIYPNGTVLSKTVGRMDIHGKAVSVQPHGRLIDADANLAVMWKVLDNPYTDNGKIDTAMLKACITMFEEAPTVLEAEEET